MTDRPPTPPSPAVRARRPADPPHLSPEASAALAAASSALEALEAPSPEPPPLSGPRKLIDLFPPAQPEAEAATTQPSAPERPAAIGLLADTTPAPSWRGGFMIMVVLLVLMFAGAAGAGWMFREPLTRAMTRWHIVR